jgi:hypothetical protein
LVIVTVGGGFWRCCGWWWLKGGPEVDLAVAVTVVALPALINPHAPSISVNRFRWLSTSFLIGMKRVVEGHEGKKTTGCCETVMKDGRSWGVAVDGVVDVVSGGPSNSLGLNLYLWYNFVRETLMETFRLASVQGFVYLSNVRKSLGVLFHSSPLIISLHTRPPFLPHLHLFSLHPASSRSLTFHRPALTA